MATGPLFWALKSRPHTITKPRSGRENPLVVKAKPNALDKLILIAIADQAEEVDWSAMVGQEELAEMAMCTTRAVRESAERLEAAGYLRRRKVVVEGTNATTWTRYYLFAPSSPVVRGLIDIDWDAPETITGREMRRQRGRVLSARADRADTPPPTPPAPAVPVKTPSEPGSGGREGRNQVPGQGRNQVPGGGGTWFRRGEEPGSGTPPEPGSGLSDSSSPLYSIDRASEELRAEPREPDGPPDRGDAQASTAARTLVYELPWGRHGMPTAEDAERLAVAVDRVMAEHGHLPVELRRHLTAALNRATSAPVPYALGALTRDRLPVSRQAVRARTKQPAGRQQEPAARQAAVAPAIPAARAAVNGVPEDLESRGLDAKYLPSRLTGVPAPRVSRADRVARKKATRDGR